MSQNVNYIEKCAEHSKYNMNHWFRYLRKFITEDGCIISDEDLKLLYNSNELTNFQKITLKRATISGSETNEYILKLNRRASTPNVDRLREKYGL